MSYMPSLMKTYMTALLEEHTERHYLLIILHTYNLFSGVELNL